MAMIMLGTAIFPAQPVTVYAADDVQKKNTVEIEEKQQETEQSNPLNLQHERPSQRIENKDFIVQATAKNATNLTLVYKKGKTAEKVPMERSADNLFTATIAGADIQPEMLEYWFEEETEDETLTSLPYLVKVVKANPRETQQREETSDASQPANEGNNPNGQTSPEEKDSTKSTTPDKVQSEEIEDFFTIEHSPITEMNGNQDVTLEATVPDASAVTLYYRTAEKMEIQELSFTKEEGTDSFSAEIPSTNFWSPHFYYFIHAEAEDGTHQETDYIKASVNFSNTPDAQTMPQVLITELAPDTDDSDGLGAYEFIEIYNNSSQPINMKDYQLIYQYPTSTADQTWDLTEDKEVAPQESFIVWIQNKSNSHLTIDDFNSHYGTTVTENQVTIIKNDGMAKNSERSIVLSDNYHNEISKVTYNESEKDVNPNQGIVYQYPAEGNAMKKVGISETSTPAEIIPGQVPAETVIVEEDSASPTIGEPDISITDEAITVEIAVESENEMQSVQLFYSQSDAIGFESIPMEASRENRYTLTLPRQSIWSNQIDYYFTAENAAGEAKTDTMEISIPSSDYDTQTVPRLLITEITPDTVNRNGADAYEFIEIYNNSTQPINIKDYKLIYRYPTRTPDQNWDLTEDKVIKPQESFIVWIHNSGNKDTVLEDFNQAYGLTLSEDRVTIIENDGMANGSERTLILADDFNNEITEATYNDGASDVHVDRGIMYKFPTEGKAMQKVGTAKSISPLTVYPEQVPHKPVQVEADTVDAPEMKQAKAEIADDAIQIQVEVESEQPLIGVNLYYSQSEALGYETVTLSSEDSTLYTASIPLVDIWSSQIQYHFIASNQAGQTTSETQTFEIPQADIEYQNVPPLLITEVVPDTANVDGADAYEFIEIYNNTTEAIDFNDYTLRYRYPNTSAENDLLWGPPLDQEDIIIPSGETIVLWVINGSNANLTDTDFNNHFGTNLRENVNLIKIFNNGMANSAERGLVIATKTGRELSHAYYNEVNGVDDTNPDKGIFYRFPIDGGTTSEKISAGEMNATPGSVMQEQVPAEKVNLAADATAPVIEDTTNKDALTSEAPFQISASITDNIEVKSVYLYYRTVESADFNKISLEKKTNDTYQHTVYEPELIGQENLEYYFAASDGRNQTTTETQNIPIEHPNQETGFRLSVKENELISGEKVIKATEETYTEDMQLFIDNEAVKNENTFMAMENEAYFAFDVTETNIYFQNAVTMGDEILTVFDDTYTNFVTLTVPISADKLQAGENVISIRAGNKASPFDETSTENRDDFTIKNVRLVLSDGTIIYDPAYDNPNTNYAVGDSAGKQSVFDFTFTLAQENFASLAYLFDTTTVTDGVHEIKAVSGENEVTEYVIADNTIPTIKPSIKDKEEYKGAFTIDAAFQDTNGIAETTATLDGSFISLPHETSSALLEPGEHELVFTATDQAGNLATQALTFTTVEEHPLWPDWLTNDPDSSSANLSVRVNDPTGDVMDVGFYEAYQYTAEDTENVRISQHATETEPPQSFEPEGETALTNAELKQLTHVDGEEVLTESTTEFPYHRFDITLDADVNPEDEIEIVWNGSSLEGRKVTMYAWNYAIQDWEALTSIIAGTDSFQLIGTVQGADYVQDGKVSAIVQDQIAAPGEDFSFVWFTDTQYYSESFPWIYENQVNWIVENQEELNIEYVFHTGDLVNVYDDLEQWEIADENMRLLDDAGIPNGVLAGNHDVNDKAADYENYYNYFGADRYQDQSHYGGSYENNRGHYDLISVNGIDFIMVYMGWGVDQAGIDWVNEVLAAHPNHTAILNFHEYLLATGMRSPIGEELFEEVVVPNENVKAVLSGHYHNAQTYIDEIDDNGDGAPDRTVYQMLADYQAGPEGGQGYLRILNFNMEDNTVDVQTYSPYLDNYNFYDPKDFPGKDEFTIDWDLEPQLKRVATDYVEVNVYANHEIGLVNNVPSGETATVTWDGLNPEKEYFWYVVAEDSYGGSTRSDIWNFATTEAEVVIPDDDEEQDEANNGTDQNPNPPTNDTDNTIDKIQDNDDRRQQPGIANQKNSQKQLTPTNLNNNQNNDKVIERTTSQRDINQNKLPGTATNMFNALLIGLALIIAGIGLWLFVNYRKKRLVNS